MLKEKGAAAIATFKEKYAQNQKILNLLKIRQDVLKDEKKIDKPTIIVLPESLFFKEEK